jgi:uridylate kinase
MGMLATTINCLRFQDALEKAGVNAKVMSAVQMPNFAGLIHFKEAIESMEAGHPVIFAAGTGIPFVSTDTTSVVRAAEIQADIILMAKSVDGIYDRDPAKDPENAVKYKTLSYEICLRDNLKATDAAASAIAEEQKINSYVFSLEDPENIIRTVCGEQIGTLVTYEKIENPEIYQK